MPPIFQHSLVTRSNSTNSYYAIIFAVLGSVILIGGVLWGYFLPRWRRKRRTPVQTRYNSVGGTSNNPDQSEQGLELGVIFPPHPAVVVPLNKKSTANGELRLHYATSIPVYDPRTHSPFPNTPRAGSCRPCISDISRSDSMKDKDALSVSNPANLHTDRLQQSHPSKSKTGADCYASHATRGKSRIHPHASSTQDDGLRYNGRSLLVARSAGAPPGKAKAARLPSGLSRPKIPSRRAHATFPVCPSSAANGADHQIISRQDRAHRLNSTHYPILEEEDEGADRENLSNMLQKPISTPGRNVFGFRNIFETPSSPGTVTTSRIGSSTNRAHLDSTPPTGPNSSAVRPPEGNDHYPGISQLVASRRFKDYMAATRSTQTPSIDVVLDMDSHLSSDDACSSNISLRMGHRPVSAPASSIKHALMINRDQPGHPSLPVFDSTIDVQLPRTLSPHSPRSSVDSVILFPRPLAFRRGNITPSPLVSPTPLGRKKQNIDSPIGSLRRKSGETRPITRGKSPRFKQHARKSTTFCLPSKQAIGLEPNAVSAYRIPERTSFGGRLALARFEGDERRSSFASISTLKMPDSFRPHFSRGGSSVYSRDTKGASAIPSPRLAGDLATSSHSPAGPSLRRAMSFDEAIFKNLDWTIQDVEATNDVSPASNQEKEYLVHGFLPQTPFPAGAQPAPDTPLIGTASSDTFGTRMLKPKISIARSSDDVFGGEPARARRSEVVIEDGRVFERVRAMESKLSQEDLARYGGRTAPGNVEWI